MAWPCSKSSFISQTVVSTFKEIPPRRLQLYLYLNYFCHFFATGLTNLEKSKKKALNMSQDNTSSFKLCKGLRIALLALHESYVPQLLTV